MTIQTQTLPYSAGGIDMVGYFAQASDAPPSPGVRVLPEWWGLNDYIRRRTEDIARLGYSALGVDLYGAGKAAGHPDEAGPLMNEVLENMEAGTLRLQAALAALIDQPGVDPSRLAAIGFCFGGGYGVAPGENRNWPEWGSQLSWRTRFLPRAYTRLDQGKDLSLSRRCGRIYPQRIYPGLSWRNEECWRGLRVYFISGSITWLHEPGSR